jgi:hypothetical protein
MKIAMFGARLTTDGTNVPSTSFPQMPTVADPKILNEVVVLAAGVCLKFVGIANSITP